MRNEPGPCVALLCLVLALGCGKKDEGAGGASVPPPVTKAAPAQPEGAPMMQPGEAPSLADIPNGPVTGVIADQPFEAKTVIVEPDIAGHLTRIIFSAQPTDEDDILIDDMQVEFNLPEPIKPGLTVERPMGEDTTGRVVYRYFDEGYGGQLCVTTTYAALLVVEAGEAGEYDPDGPFVQTTGSLSGKVAVYFDDQATGGEQPLKEASWIAGSFEAQVRHWGPPGRSASQ